MVRLGHRSDFSPAGSGALYAPQGTQKENSTAGRSRHVAVNGSGRIPRDENTAAAYSMWQALFLVAMHFAKPML